MAVHRDHIKYCTEHETWPTCGDHADLVNSAPTCSVDMGFVELRGVIAAVSTGRVMVKSSVFIKVFQKYI